MSLFQKNFLNKKNIILKFINLFIFFFFLFSTVVSPAHEDELPKKELSSTAQKTIEKLQKIDFEVGNYGRVASELILHCSYVQDLLLAYLHDAENLEEFHEVMQFFQENSHCFNSVCKYITSVFNFYTAESESPQPHETTTYFKGKEELGFLNTFKVKEELTPEERAVFFEKEYSKFLRDGTVQPFILDESSLSELQTNTVYNFVLLPDGTIRASLERPGDREYRVLDEMVLEVFSYPNHTILAGDPEQVVLSAGAFIVHQFDDKRLFFISCKSGHFQPTYWSLEFMRLQLADLGVNPCTVVPVPDLDMSRAVIKTYKGAQVPVLLTKYDVERLFHMANNRWQGVYKEMDRSLLADLARGDVSSLDAKLKETLKKQRAESTYMRSAYHLFSADHQPPENFGELVKRFGKLKDTIKRFGTAKFNIERMQEEASAILDLMDKYEKEMASFKFVAADDISFHTVFCENISEMLELLSRKSLNLEDHHQLKKLARETGALFMYMAHDAEFKGRGFLIFRTAADGFFQINDLMASTEYTYAPQSDEDQEIHVIVSRKIANQLTKYISHLGIAPTSFGFTIDPKEAWWMINNAKEVYFSSKYIRDIFEEIEDGRIDEQNINYAEILSELQWLKRHAERARNMLLFLDITHRIPELYQTFLNSIDSMIVAVTNHEYAWIKKESARFHDVCYYAPSSGLENWQCTDQESFNETMQATLNYLHPLQKEKAIFQAEAKEILSKVQAFRDFINLNRRNGLFTGDKTKPHLPMACFDALEEHADALLEEITMELERGSEEIVITPDMTIHATFILSRVLLQETDSAMLSEAI